MPKINYSSPDAALKEAKKAWSQAITKTDSHSMKCRPCNKRQHPLALAKATGTLASIDPYKPCRKAHEFWLAETATREAYQALGGLLGIVLLCLDCMIH
mgnify:CR=1 FL=1